MGLHNLGRIIKICYDGEEVIGKVVSCSILGEEKEYTYNLKTRCGIIEFRDRDVDIKNLDRDEHEAFMRGIPISILNSIKESGTDIDRLYPYKEI